MNHVRALFTSDPSGKVARNVTLFGLFEVRKKLYTWYIIYSIHGILYALYIVYYMLYKWYIIHSIRGILYTLYIVYKKNLTFFLEISRFFYYFFRFS
jgi:hypothetical protein